MDSVGIILQLEEIYNNFGYILVFLGSMIETSPIGFTIPGGLIVATGGFFAYSNNINLAGIIISGWLGMLVTFVGGYVLGRYTGTTFAKKLRQEIFLAKAQDLLNNHGAVILTTSLLANLTRFWIAYVAGSQKFSFVKFIFYASAASLTWNSLLVSIGYLAGSERHNLEVGLARLGIISWLLLVVAVGVIYFNIRRDYTLIRKRKV